MKLGRRTIGPGHPCLVVAELSCNHGGSLDRARELVAAAHAAGADAIKLQTYTPDSMTLNRDEARFRLASGPWAGRKLWELYAEAQTPWEWHEEVFALADQLGLEAFSAPFSLEAVRFLDTLHVPAYKIASPELGWDDLILACVATKKPIILSTGMASPDTIAHAAALVPRRQRVLLHCVSAYPAPRERMMLRRMSWLMRHTKQVGLSDHSLGHTADVLAVGLGAVMIEKHLRLADGPITLDHAHSLDPAQFAAMVDAVREAEQMIWGEAEGVEQASEGFRRRYVEGQWVRCGP